MIVGLAFQQAMIFVLLLTTYVYKYGLSACYDCMAGLTAIYDSRSGLSAGHDCMAELTRIAIYNCKDAHSKAHDCRAGSYNKL